MTSDIQTQNAILRISDEKTYQLLELYQQEECLWNTYSEDYKSRDKRQKATERIARKLNVKHFEARHVVIKFKNLRNSYCQELKKIAASKSMGLSEAETYKPRVFWFSKMDSFLRPHLQPSKSAYPTLPAQDSDDRVQKTESERSVGSVSVHSEESNHSYPYPNVDIDVSMHSMQHSMNSDDCVPARKRPRRYSYPRREDLSISLSQMVKDLEAKIQALTQEKKEDYYDSFGKYVASLLRSLPKEKAMLLQPQVISLIVSGSGIGEGSVSQSDDRE